MTAARAHAATLELDLSGCVLTDRALEVLRHLPRLEKFAMRWQSGITDAGIANLELCDQLEGVDLMGTQTVDGAIRALAGKSRLRRFKSGRLVTDAGVATLARLDGLSGLGFFWHAKAITPAALLPLTQLPNLGFLSCEGALCDDTAMRHIAAMLKTYYAGKTRITDRSLEILAEMSSLEKLMFWETEGLTDEGVRLLKRLPRLRELSLEGLPNVSAEVLAELPGHVRVNDSP